jgi:hypothetical protein
MERDILAKILQAEQNIQTKIDTTIMTCREQIQRLKEEAEERIVQEEALVREECRRALEEADELAQKKAAALLETEARMTEKLSALTDEALKRVIMKHITRILPGEKYDRTHVQG